MGTQATDPGTRGMVQNGIHLQLLLSSLLGLRSQVWPLHCWLQECSPVHQPRSRRDRCPGLVSWAMLLHSGANLQSLVWSRTPVSHSPCASMCVCVCARACRAEMLERMYLRWAQSMGYDARVTEHSPGEGAGIKNAELEILGHFA